MNTAIVMLGENTGAMNWHKNHQIEHTPESKGLFTARKSKSQSEQTKKSKNKRQK